MDRDQLKAKITIMLPSVQVLDGKQFPEINVEPELIHKVAKTLKDSGETSFDYLYCITGVDYGDSLGVIYHLESTKHKHTVVLKTKTADKSNPVIPTVSDIWHTAEYHEREVYDFFGITFKNHPDMRRFFLEESWSGYPLRKDYTDEENIIER
jgi:NADH-quinone oxidoreductase subunit C